MKAVEGLGRILSMVQVTAAPLTANQGIYLSALELFRTCPEYSFQTIQGQRNLEKPPKHHGTQLLKPDFTWGSMLFVTLSGVQHIRAVRAEAQHFGHTLLSRSRSGSAAPVLPRKARSGPNPAGRRPLPATPGTAALCPAKPARERRSPKAPHGHSGTGAPQGNSGHTRGAQVCRSECTAAAWGTGTAQMYSRCDRSMHF